MNKATFISRLEQTRAEWDAALAQLTEQRLLQPGMVGRWSGKDLLAHVSWYEREMVPVIRSHVFTGSEWWGLSTDERNARIYQENCQRSFQEIIHEGQRSYRDLLDAVHQLSDEDLTDAHHFRGMPAEWVPWQIFAGNSFEHYQEHLPALRAWANSKPDHDHAEG